jgi:hypothetical protein
VRGAAARLCEIDIIVAHGQRRPAAPSCGDGRQRDELVAEAMLRSSGQNCHTRKNAREARHRARARRPPPTTTTRQGRRCARSSVPPASRSPALQACCSVATRRTALPVTVNSNRRRPSEAPATSVALTVEHRAGAFVGAGGRSHAASRENSDSRAAERRPLAAGVLARRAAALLTASWRHSGQAHGRARRP